MTKEEEQLLLTDICARLPFGVMVCVQGNEFDSYKYPYQLTAINKFGLDSFCKVYHPVYTPFGVPKVEDVKPYLRPMSSMTEEEKKEYHAIDSRAYTCPEDIAHIPAADRIEWLNAHHFDYRSLIPTGLALEAPEGMYKTE